MTIKGQAKIVHQNFLNLSKFDRVKNIFTKFDRVIFNHSVHRSLLEKNQKNICSDKEFFSNPAEIKTFSPFSPSSPSDLFMTTKGHCISSSQKKSIKTLLGWKKIISSIKCSTATPCLKKKKIYIFPHRTSSRVKPKKVHVDQGLSQK